MEKFTFFEGQEGSLELTTTSATSMPSSAGGLVEGRDQEMHRRLLSMESKLKEVDLHLKERLPKPKEQEEVPRRWREQVEELRAGNSLLEAKAQALERTLAKEREEQQASLQAYSKAMNKSIEHMSTSIDQSIEESTSLMKARMVEAETLVQKLVGQLNGTFAKAEGVAPQGQSELVQSMKTLLEEHQQLVSRQQQLLAKRTSGEGQAINFLLFKVSPPSLQKTASGALGGSVASASPRSPRSMKRSGSPSPAGSSPAFLAGSLSPRSPSMRLSHSGSQGQVTGSPSKAGYMFYPAQEEGPSIAI